ncbi:hypothetical protein MJM59_32285, partial [Salmonella enterica subsp. enterica serovar Montevideo]|nr:hypothetical protein [Salmonella enterica subsp. enterica serovar Montevideo]
CSVTTDAPPELCDDICLSPDIWPNWRSSGAVTAEVMTSGLAPVPVGLPGRRLCRYGSWLVSTLLQ